MKHERVWFESHFYRAGFIWTQTLWPCRDTTVQCLSFSGLVSGDTKRRIHAVGEWAGLAVTGLNAGGVIFFHANKQLSHNCDLYNQSSYDSANILKNSSNITLKEGL